MEIRGCAATEALGLIAHPCATIRSFEEAKLDQIFFGAGHPFTRRELAELSWTVAHQNILALRGEVPPERWRTVSFEQLVREPRRVLAAVCAFLGLAYEPAMARPYESRRGRMIDGIHAQ
jgi:hypothetical protein